MSQSRLGIKLTFIEGLQQVVVKEVRGTLGVDIAMAGSEAVYLESVLDLQKLLSLRSILRAYLIVQDVRYNPRYVSRHKSVLGNLIKTILDLNLYKFKTYKIFCAGSDSPEVRSVAEYVQTRFKLSEEDESDLKIHMIKLRDTWEVGVQITPKPLSQREYKIRNMNGAMDPTIAYAVNSFCNIDNAQSYLNVFSGSGTLLIEAGQCYPHLTRLLGFDNSKEHISLAIQNIRKSGLIKRIKLKEIDIFDDSNLGKFDVITSDLPFGMAISKDEDLGVLYQRFIEYCEAVLNRDGLLAVYTSQYEIFENVLQKSKFDALQTIELKLMTSANIYLHPKIFVCRFR